DANATVTVNDKPVTSGAASDPISLKTGPNTIAVVVTSQNGVTAKTYKITVIRATTSTNDNLALLNLSAGTLTPAFITTTTGYTANVDNTVTSIAVTPATSNANATVTVNGVAVASGAASGPVTLALGPNTINVVVTAGDGIVTKTYTITVTRAAGGD